jgi:hypothetical protein
VTVDVELYTTSRIRAANRCQRYHHYRYDLGASFGDDDTIRFGLGAHLGLEHWFGAFRRGADPLGAMLDALAAADLDAFERARLRALLVAYDARWREQPYDVLAVEQEFRTTLNGIPFGGKMDALVRDRTDGRTYVVEHKTSGQDVSPGSVYWQRLRLDTQITVYVEGAAALGHDVEGVIYDVLVRPAQRPLRATPADRQKLTKAGALRKGQRVDDETPDEFEARVAEAIAGDPAAYFQRGTVVRLADELPGLRRDLVETVELIRFGKRTGQHPRNPDACASYGRLCAFFPVCTGAADIDSFPRGPAHRELAAA